MDDKRLRLPRWKRRSFAVITVLGPLTLLLACGEVAGRMYVHFRYGVPGKSYGIYMKDAELGATHRPNSYNSNSVLNNWGFRNLEDVTEQKPRGATRIYCSGGSTTFCYNLPTQEAWPTVLQRELRRIPGHTRDEVLNAGQIAWPVAHEFTFAKRVVPRLKPDIVIIYTGVNELLAAGVMERDERQNLDRLLAERRWGIGPRQLDQARFLKRHSVLVRLWDYRVKSWLEARLQVRYDQSAHRPARVHPWIDHNFEQTLRAYVRFLQQNGSRVIIVRYGDDGVENWYLINSVRVFRDRAVAIGREMGATICDMASEVERHPRRRELFGISGVHVSQEGAEFLGRLLTESILRLSPVGSGVHSSLDGPSRN